MKTTIINKILLVLMLITAQQVSALEFQVDGIYYRTSIFTKNSAYVTHSGTSYTESVEYQGEVVIPESVTYNGKTYTIASIGGYAFAGCPGLTSVTIPNTVTTINQNAFNGCTGLTSITIPNSVISIGYTAFYGCTGLTNVVIGNSVTSIGNLAFYNCSGLTNVISLSASPPTCDSAAFAFVSVENITLEVPSESVSLYQTADTWKDFGKIEGIAEDESELPTDNSGLSYNILNETDVEVIAGTEKYTGDIVIPSQTTIDGKVYNVIQIGDAAFNRCSDLTSVTIPNSVTSIGSDAFFYCSGLTSITIPNSVTSIGSEVFYNCTGLTSITIPNSVTSIGYCAFGSCTGLTSITIPNRVTSIEDYAFYYCGGLTNVIIPNSVTSIGSWAFSLCSGLTNITIGNNVTSIGDYAFSYCSGLTNVIIPNSVTIIGAVAFQGCSGLTSVTIGNSVSNIADFAFDGCSGLASVIIPSSVTSIGDFAFGDCNGLTSVISLNLIPPTCETNVFNNVSVGNITLEVPAESVSLYQSADTWNDFGTIKAVSSASRSESSGIDDIFASDDEVEYYNLQGVRVMNPGKGIYIKRQGGKTSKVVL